MRWVMIIWCLYALMCRMAVVQGQSLSFQHLNKQKGFSQSVCYDVLKDKQGYLWITTISGLYRYDGNRFEDFTQGNNVLKGHALVSLIEDLNGDLWLSRFGAELVHYRRQEHSFEIIALSKLSADMPAEIGLVQLLHVDGQNRIWMQLSPSSLACYDPNDNTVQYIGDETLEMLKLFPQKGDPTEPLVAATTKGDDLVLSGFLDKDLKIKWTNSFSDWPLKPSALAMTDGEHLWGIRGHTLMKYSFEQKTCTTYPLEVLADTKYDPGSLYADPNGHLWLSADGGLLHITTSPKPLATYHHNRADDGYSIAGTAVPHHVDRDGILWTTVYGKGISYAQLGSLRFPNVLPEASVKEINASNYVRAICATQHGITYVAVQSGGVMRLDSSYAAQPHVLPPEAGVVEHLLCEKGKGVWMAGKTLFLLQKNESAPISYPTPTPDFKGFTVVHRSSDGQLLAGGYQSFYHFDEATGSFHLPKGIPQNGTYCVIYSLKNNHLLVCRRDEGVSLYAKNEDGYSLVKEVDANLYVKCITRATDGRLLLATTIGLYHYDENTQTALPLEEVNQRLPDLYLYSILQDENDRYWTSTNAGLCLWDREYFQWFDMGHGLQDLEFNTNAFCKTASGDLLFGGVNGINLIPRNQNLSALRRKPSLHLKSLASRDVELGEENILAEGEAMLMGWGNNALELEYALLEYFRPERMRVRYRLEGHDDTWQRGPSHGRVRFANVAPGRYTYEMQAADANGNWDSTVQSWVLLIKPLWWQTWWTRSAAILLMMAMAFFALKAYTARKLQQQRETLVRETAVQRERERITADLHDDIGATLSSMYLYGDLANTVWQEKPEESRKMLGTITTHSQELMQRMSDIVWSLKSAEEVSASLSVRLRNHARELVEGTGLKVKIELEEALDRSLRNPVVRKNLLLITKEAMNNVVKYSEAQHLRIAMYCEGELVHLRITDDGKGFDINTIEQGNGLSNMRQRCERLGGEIKFESAPGEGCTVHCTLPMAIIRQGLAS